MDETVRIMLTCSPEIPVYHPRHSFKKNWGMNIPDPLQPSASYSSFSEPESALALLARAYVADSGYV